MSNEHKSCNEDAMKKRKYVQAYLVLGLLHDLCSTATFWNTYSRPTGRVADVHTILHHVKHVTRGMWLHDTPYERSLCCNGMQVWNVITHGCTDNTQDGAPLSWFLSSYEQSSTTSSRIRSLTNLSVCTTKEEAQEHAKSFRLTTQSVTRIPCDWPMYTEAAGLTDAHADF